MPESLTNRHIQGLSEQLDGELFFDALHKSIYATDASVYRKIPLAVAYPKTKKDLKQLISFGTQHRITLVPRTAGTSLGGQCVGDGIIVDLSKHFTKILAFDERLKTVTVEPGVIRDELNAFLAPYDLFFGPNTSTSNRCMIGGMVGNNSSGTTSIQYGVTRDKVISLETILSDGSEVTFEALSNNEFKTKQLGTTLENKIYKTIHKELASKEVQQQIVKEFPKAAIHRRNTGYAIDTLIATAPFSASEEKINLAKLVCGSEGTLAFTTAITLQLDAVPPPQKLVVAAHFSSIRESMEAVLVAMKHPLYMCELMDKTILDCTKSNRKQLSNRFFIEGDPEAILLLEVKADTQSQVTQLADQLIADLQQQQFGYAYPKLYNENVNKAIELRKAGLGLLGNIVGDSKAVACIEDTAVDVTDLPAYIAEFTAMLDGYQQKAVYYAHAGAGEIHLRPILDLKKSEDVTLFKTITTETAKLVKKYKGSFSGEHGDGIVRSSFIPFMIGRQNYEVLKRIKYVFDPQAVFNKGKIIDAFAMDTSLRYETDRIEPEIETLLDFSDSLGLLRATEKCNGSGDCRKTSQAGGMMCPSYRATRNEKDTTRARANALREFLTNSQKPNKFNHTELKEAFDLCLSCKACASECPSNVDVASFKAEFLYQYQKENPPSLRTKLFADNVKYNKIGSKIPLVTNLFIDNRLTKSILGIALKRKLPKLARQTLYRWYKEHQSGLKNNHHNCKKIVLFCDEFTNFYDVQVGIDTIELLDKLGYCVNLVKSEESGRSHISKGFLDKAKVIADKNIAIFKELIDEETPLLGIEPSAILSFRDEYLRLADDKKAATNIAENTFTIEEFIQHEIQLGAITPNQFDNTSKTIKIHGHCHQKSLSSTEATFSMLNLPVNYKVTIINSGCCGMAGSFGYEKEHYELSMQVGEQSLFSKIRKFDTNTTISAAGTSCRHQIYDGTKRMAKHPVTILKEALL